MDKIYDVIICGAGPAGSIAAIELKRKGLSVLLIDEKAFPRDKVCGDQITPLGVNLLKELGLVDETFIKFSNEIDKMKIQGPKSACANIEFDLKETQSKIVITPRLDLDNHLVNHAEKAGADRHTGHFFAINQQSDYISTRCKSDQGISDFKGKILIGADGSSSTIARLANLKPSKRRGIAIRAYLHGIDLKADRLEGYFDKQWLPGYAWLFPTSENSANIGLGMKAKDYKKAGADLQKLMRLFIDQPYIKSRLKSDYKIENIASWPLNIGPPRWDQLVSHRLLLIGDAASLINPFTGGGIETGIISGKLAADVISNKISADSFSRQSLRDYSKKLKKTLNMEQTLFLIATKIAGSSPRIVEFLIKLVEISDLPFIFMKYMYKGNRVRRIDNSNQ